MSPPRRERLVLRAAVLLLACGVCAGRAAGAEATEPEAALPDLFRKQPYLIFPGDPTRMRVLWQLTASAPSTISWGPDTACALGSAATSEYGVDHQHAYTISALAPGATYHYRVTAGDATYRGLFAAVPPAGASSASLFVYGDTRTYPAIHNTLARAMMARAAADPDYRSLLLVAADLVNNGDSETDWTNQLFSAAYPDIRALMASLPFHSSMGNHEGTGALFVKYFPYPFVGGRYWSFDYGPVHVAVVDQYTSYAPGSAQLIWLKGDLAGSAKPWKLVLLHEPGWSAGGGHANNTAVQSLIQPLCEEHGVAMVIGGHNHYYARAVVGGVQHVTTGGGGAPLHTPDPGFPNVVATARENHYCEVAVSGAAMAFRAIADDGAVLDEFRIWRPVAIREELSLSPAGRDLGLASERARDPFAVTVSPNPFRSETLLEWWAGGEPQARLVIVDVEGRTVREYAPTGAGRQAVRWDATDRSGRPVAPGVYLYRVLDAPGAEPAGRIVLVR